MQLNELLKTDNIIKLLTHYGATKIKTEGNSIRSTCPLHNGDNPSSFVWNLENNLWYCFTDCNQGGDIFTFISIKLDLSVRHDFHKILDIICSILGLSKESIDLKGIQDRNKRELNQWISYVNKQGAKQSINKPYNIKLLGNSFKINNYRGYESNILDKHGVFYNKDLNRVGFKMCNEDGEVIGASLRRVDEQDTAKWLHRPKGIDTGYALFNLHNVKGMFDSVYIVEGIIDVLALNKIGIENVVCTFGANITDEQIDLLIKYFIKIVPMYDGDLAGLRATYKIVKKCSKIFDIQVISLYESEYKDPDYIKTVEDFNSLKLFKVKEWLNYLKQEGYDKFIKELG